MILNSACVRIATAAAISAICMLSSLIWARLQFIRKNTQRKNLIQILRLLSNTTKSMSLILEMTQHILRTTAQEAGMVWVVPSQKIYWRQEAPSKTWLAIQPYSQDIEEAISMLSQLTHTGLEISPCDHRAHTLNPLWAHLKRKMKNSRFMTTWRQAATGSELRPMEATSGSRTPKTMPRNTRWHRRDNLIQTTSTSMVLTQI